MLLALFGILAASPVRAGVQPDGPAWTPAGRPDVSHWTRRFIPVPAHGIAERRLTGDGLPFAYPSPGLPDPLAAPAFQVAGKATKALAAAVGPLPKNAGYGTVSGLPWASGAACDIAAFGSMRGRPNDVYVEFLERSNWATVIRNAGGRATKYANRTTYPGRVVISLPMMTNDTRGQHKQCAEGSFDDEITSIVQPYADKGIDDVIFRLGWEPNGDGNFPWSAFLSNPEIYKACFRRQAMLIRDILPTATIDWTNRRGNDLPYSVDYIYPGDDFVDIIGVMVYDRWPIHPNQTSWNSAYNLRDEFGGPKGLNSYLRMAKAHGKPLSISEWAISNNDNDPSSRDNPFFIEKMFEFFRDNASEIAYEAYFNCGSTVGSGSNGGYRLAPNTANPLSRAKYKALWSPAS
jgi:hypothetical protein